MRESFIVPSYGGAKVSRREAAAAFHAGREVLRDGRPVRFKKSKRFDRISDAHARLFRKALLDPEASKYWRFHDEDDWAKWTPLREFIKECGSPVAFVDHLYNRYVVIATLDGYSTTVASITHSPSDAVFVSTPVCRDDGFQLRIHAGSLLLAKVLAE